MTNEQFKRDYQLLDRVTEGAVETYHAQAMTGAMVMVHYLRGSDAENREISALIEQLDAERKRRVLNSIDVDGVPALITRFILDFRTLRDWLAAPGPATPPAPEPVAPPPPSKAQPGEFTRMFSSSPAPASPPEQPAAPPPPKKEPGEFTRMFAQPSEPAAGAAPPPPAREPGEFTRMFGAADRPSGSPPAEKTPTSVADPVVAPPPAPPASSSISPPQPGASSPSYSLPSVEPPSVAPPPAAAPTPGSYTRLFGSPGLPAAPEDSLFPNPPAAGTSGNEDYFQRLSKGVQPPPSSAPLPSAPPPPAYTGQSEFTRVISAVPAPPPPAPPPPPVTSAPAPARTNRLFLFGLIGVVLTAVIFTIVLIVLG